MTRKNAAEDIFISLVAIGLGYAKGKTGLSAYRYGRGRLYGGARGMGNWQPILEGSPRKIVRRAVYRRVGRIMGKFAFGGGLFGSWVGKILGIK